MDISGSWTYNEDFEYGNSVGAVELTQTGNQVSGVFSFTEEVENNYSIRVTEKVKGTITDGKLLLKSVEVKAMQNGREINYLPNTFEAQRITETQIIGSTYDSENVCGVFVLTRKA
ncbi:hypothetical protein [uncultured Draconibacterium sp.]|uniref:hypothetical protein n=1 Tax=uncultured Draconibacterium sp. TaxID=1573823 RepID=UPI0029C91B28|nr:hypothetical protein [uncultured Draconibacterium sp.]